MTIYSLKPLQKLLILQIFYIDLHLFRGYTVAPMHKARGFIHFSSGERTALKNTEIIVRCIAVLGDLSCALFARRCSSLDLLDGEKA